MVIANGSSRARATIQLLTLAVIYALTQPGNWLLLPVCGLIGASVCSVAVPLSSRLWAQYDDLVKRESADVGLVPYSWRGAHQYEQQEPYWAAETFEQKSTASVNNQRVLRGQQDVQQPNNRSVLSSLHPDNLRSHRHHRSHDAQPEESPSERWDVRKVMGACVLAEYVHL